MPRGYSRDLRERALQAVTSGLPMVEVARIFDVSVDSLVRWWERAAAGTSLAPGHGSGRPRLIARDQEAALAAQVRATPDATLAEHCAAWEASHGVGLSPATMCRALQRLSFPRKKRP